MKRIILTSLLTFFFINIYSQNVQIHGYVTDLETGERIIGAIILNKYNNKSVSTNSYGFYSIECQKNVALVLQCSYIGYLSSEIMIDTLNNQEVNFHLKKGILLKQVIITANKEIVNNTDMGTNNLQIYQIKLLPSLGGENDILKAIQLLPGVQSGTEGTSGLFVRGGGIDQNLILLDDVPLYYVNHLGGFVSIFNSDAIKNVKLIKGNFPARYGGRLSSVLDIRLKEGNMKKFSANYTISPLTSKFLIEGPLKKDTSSFLLSVRGLFWGFAYAQLLRIFFNNFTINYNFYDVNMKLNYKLNDKNRLFLSFYYGDDNFIPKVYLENKKEKVEMPTRWGNTLVALRWNTVFSSKFFSNTTLSYTRYRYEKVLKYSDKVLENYNKQDFYTGINDLSLKYEIQYFAGNYMNFRAGIEAIHHYFEPGAFYSKVIEHDSVLFDSTFGNKNIFSNEVNLFLENRIKLGKYFKFNIGFRFVNYFIDNKDFNALEPRFILNLKINSKTSIKASFSQNHQNIHLLTGSTVGIPVDLWMPATSIAVPEKAFQYSIGYYRIIADNLILSIESYYKKMSNLISFSEGLDFYGAAQNWEHKIETNGIGSAYGLEVLLKKNIGKLTGWISYAYAKSNRQFDNINNGKPYPFKYDRRNSINIVANYHLNDKVNFSANWVYGSGYPFTFMIGKYIYLVNEHNLEHNSYYDWIYLYPDKNSFRMRAFHHLDIAINFTKQKKRTTRIWSISIYNVYNRHNPFFYFIQEDNKNKLHLYQQSLFPIIPSVSYSLKF